jgi:ubiquinone/menaquinone biosynthesis C-methylase UbiE
MTIFFYSNLCVLRTEISCLKIVFLVQERRYLFKEFPELASCEESSKLLEVGCGNGSTALPILR